MSMGILLNSAGGGGGSLGGTEGRATRGEWSTEKGVGRAEVECAGVTVIDRSIDWKASLVNHAWSILWAAMYQASRSVSVGHLNGMVAIWLWMLDLRPRWNFTTRVQGSVYPASEIKVRKVSR